MTFINVILKGDKKHLISWEKCKAFFNGILENLCEMIVISDESLISLNDTIYCYVHTIWTKLQFYSFFIFVFDPFEVFFPVLLWTKFKLLVQYQRNQSFLFCRELKYFLFHQTESIFVSRTDRRYTICPKIGIFDFSYNIRKLFVVTFFYLFKILKDFLAIISNFYFIFIYHIVLISLMLFLDRTKFVINFFIYWLISFNVILDGIIIRIYLWFIGIFHLNII